MAYESKIRTFNPDRVTKNTTISQTLLHEIKKIAANRNEPYAYLLDEAIDYILNTYKNQRDFVLPEKPTDRKQMATTLSHTKYTQLQQRARKLKTTANTLLEIGMKQIIHLHSPESPK